VAEYLHRQASIEAMLDKSGKVGELTVWVGNTQVIRKGFFKFPAKEEVLTRVRRQLDTTGTAQV